MSGYGIFAQYYDKLTNTVGYDKQAEYLLRLFDLHGKRPTLMLDLACGTGNMSIRLVKEGISVIGADMSPDMLYKAQQKAMAENLDILFICQKMQDIDLYGTIDGAICTLDSINHLLRLQDVQRVFDKVSLFMEKDGLFIFDVNTIYKHEKILADNVFVYELDDVFCVWQNEYNNKNNIVNITLDFFERDGQCYFRRTEHFSERAYSDTELIKMLNQSGFELCAVYGDYKLEKPDNKCQRKVFVARKMEETNGKID